MNIKEFFGKFVSKYILLNLMAMAILVALIVFGVKYGLDEYTRHGEEIEVFCNSHHDSICQGYRCNCSLCNCRM